MFRFFRPYTVFFIYIRMYVYIYIYSHISRKILEGGGCIVVLPLPPPPPFIPLLLSRIFRAKKKKRKKNNITPSTFTRSDTQWFVNVRKRKTRATRYARAGPCTFNDGLTGRNTCPNPLRPDAGSMSLHARECVWWAYQIRIFLLLLLFRRPFYSSFV